MIWSKSADLPSRTSSLGFCIQESGRQQSSRKCRHV
jgi:hypothetical protein